MKNIHFLPNVITTFGLTCGLFVIFKNNMLDVGGSTFESVQSSIFILLMAAVADMLDGAVARAMRAESDFGGIFDSLSDAVTFGVAPSVLVLKALSVAPGSKLSFLVTSSAMIFAVCGVLRLVRFSVSPKEKNESPFEKRGKPNFDGLPIPAAACCLVSLTLFLVSADFTGPIGINFRIGVLALAQTFLGYLMVSHWPFPSLNALQLRILSFQYAFIIVILVVLALFGVLYHFPFTFMVVSWGYLVGTLYYTVKRAKGNAPRSKKTS